MFSIFGTKIYLVGGGTIVWLYQLTDDGLALELTVKEMKYYKNDDLN